MPSDASNLLGLTQQLLRQCLQRPQDYSLRRVDLPRRGKVDLVVYETDGRHEVSNHVQFVATGSKVSAAARLAVVSSPGADHRILVTEDARRCRWAPRAASIWPIYRPWARMGSCRSS